MGRLSEWLGRQSEQLGRRSEQLGSGQSGWGGGGSSWGGGWSGWGGNRSSWGGSQSSWGGSQSDWGGSTEAGAVQDLPCSHCSPQPPLPSRLLSCRLTELFLCLVPINSWRQEALPAPLHPSPRSRWAPDWRVEKWERTLGAAHGSAPWQTALKEAHRMRRRSLGGQEQGLAIPK